jgi:hypothetical protein
MAARLPEVLDSHLEFLVEDPRMQADQAVICFRPVVRKQHVDRPHRPCALVRHDGHLALVVSEDRLPHVGEGILERQQRLPLEGVTAIPALLVPEYLTSFPLPPGCDCSPSATRRRPR